MDHPPSDSEYDIVHGHRPPKRARHSLSPNANGNGHASSSSSPLPPLSLSILGIEPIDEFILEIADFVHHMIMTRPEHVGKVEVEAKVGVLRDKATGQRVQLPILTETILQPDGVDCRFESNMSPMQHKHFNKLLNDLKVNHSHPTSPLEYKHHHLIDTFYPSDSSRDKTRVTRYEKTGEVKECLRKVRLGNLEIHCPKQMADWRISVNLEVPVPPPLGTASLTRRKDRLSYSHEEFVIDLTQVTSTMSPNAKPEILHELELEIARPEYLLSVAMKRGDQTASEHERSAFDELIRAFVNNARILVKNANEGWQ